MAIETTAGRFEHFSFGSIETYFNMDGGEFWQGSGQSLGTNQSANYATGNVTPSVTGNHVNNLWGSLGATVLSYYNFTWGDGAIWVYGTGASPGNNSNKYSATLVRYSMPGWSRNKAFLCNTTFAAETASASVGLTNEFIPPPVLLAGTPVMNLTPNTYSGVSVFAPAYIGVFSPLENSYWGLIGQYPNQRICNLINNNPKDVVIYGSDEWVLFPLASKGSTTYNGTWPVISGNYGVAYRK